MDSKQYAGKPGKKMGANCSICSSKFRTEIEMVVVGSGVSYRKAAQMCVDKGYGNITHKMLINHFDRHVDTKRVVQLKYLINLKAVAEGDMPAPDDIEGVKLHELKHLDASIRDASMLVTMAAAVIQEQLQLRVHGTREKAKVLADGETEKGSYVPLQQAVVQLYKTSSEELRQSIKTKMEILGEDAASQQAEAMVSLVDILMAVDKEDASDREVSDKDPRIDKPYQAKKKKPRQR